MPDRLKTGVENLSGLSMDDVRVHRNSSKPAQVQAAAYTQGTDIHVAPGQERHLPHEAWHVVRQMQNRVQSNMQLKGVGINNDAGLEKEASVMGAKAEQQASVVSRQPVSKTSPVQQAAAASGYPVQRFWKQSGEFNEFEEYLREYYQLTSIEDRWNLPYDDPPPVPVR